jgi:2-polyprenyl-3-methyl-5-hydroxy-6-metoxy-1,4-benzoquinol methylase
MKGDLLTAGNTAKLYCLTIIERLVEASGVGTTLVDLGCGAGLNIRTLLQRHTSVRYIGVDPSRMECERARENLTGLNAEIHHGRAQDVRLPQADIVISFSVLEHVVDRRGYLEVASRALKPAGVFMINYDSGHFVAPAPGRAWQRGSDRWNNVLGPFLARFGFEGSYQAFVREEDFRRWIEDADLRIVDEKFFNTDLKHAFAYVPAARKDEFMRGWLQYELSLNRMGIAYSDSLAPVFRTRSFCLVHSHATNVPDLAGSGP